MKILSHTFSLLLIVASGLSLASCTNNEITPDDNQETYTVTIGWDGDIIDMAFEPLSRGETSKDLYAIQVYSKTETDAESENESGWIPYAQGIFSHAEELTINLLKGHVYKFSATMFVDGVERLWVGDAPFYSTINNAFIYRSDKELNIWNNSVNLNDVGHHYRPNIDRYGGELSDYKPGDNGSKAKIKMKRLSFGAKFIAKGKLAASGTLEVRIANAPTMLKPLSKNENQVSDIFTFYGLRQAWMDNDYSETVPVTINWIKEDSTVIPLGIHDVVYKRNATTVVNIYIENEGEDSELGFEIDESETGDPVEDGENDMTIVDGEVENTEIDTNK